MSFHFDLILKVSLIYDEPTAVHCIRHSLSRLLICASYHWLLQVASTGAFNLVLSLLRVFLRRDVYAGGAARLSARLPSGKFCGTCVADQSIHACMLSLLLELWFLTDQIYTERGSGFPFRSPNQVVAPSSPSKDEVTNQSCFPVLP